MAVDAVQCEPVSGFGPVTGKNTGIFAFSARNFAPHSFEMRCMAQSQSPQLKVSEQHR
jgi:hypothetical protein